MLMTVESRHLSFFIIIALIHGIADGIPYDNKTLPDAASWMFPDFLATIDYLPEQVHLSLGNDAYSMVVMWSTYEEYDEGTSYVHYGLGPNNFTQKSKAKSEDLRNANPRGCKGVYHATMVDLVPHRIYSYKVETNGHFSENFTFRHLAKEANRSSRYLVYGDLGKIGGGVTVAKLKAEAGKDLYDAVIHVGDFAYDLHDDGGRRGDHFMKRIEPIATRIPYMHCPGNHEIANGFIHYRHRFSSPNVPWPIPVYQMWYSFDIGLVHFISYSTEVYFTYNQGYVSSQYSWLKDDLDKANSNRHVRPWVIAFGHRPMYCSNYNTDDCTKDISSMRQEPYNLERLFHTKGVDMIIEAHEHSYERLYPLYNGTQTDCGYTNPSSAVHLIAGSAGCNEFEMICADIILIKPHTWSAKRAWLPGLNGYGRLNVINSTHITWEQVMSLSDEPLDTFTLIQEQHGPRDTTDVIEHTCPDT